jgi:hypothetical protein
MRTIKFRAWVHQKDNEHMLKWKDILKSRSTIGEGYEVEFPIAELNCTGYSWMQFTGLRDVKGLDAYEGDIYNCGYKYSDGTHKYGDRNIIKDIRDFDPEDSFEIIGNIHQNPELL